jgi:hypothetical protein
MIVDGSLMEVEADGRTMATCRLPTTQGDRVAVAFAAVGGSARIVELDAWSLRPPGAPDQRTPSITG